MVGTESENPALPRRKGATPTIEFAFGGWRGAYQFQFRKQRWVPADGEDVELFPPEPGLVLYARVDGRVCVFDSARNPRSRWSDSPLEPPFIFSQQAIWDGLPIDLPNASPRPASCS